MSESGTHQVPRRLLTFEELADLTGRPIKTLRHQRLHGEGLGSVGFRVDGRILFDVGEVDDYIAAARARDRREREAQNGG